MFKIKFKIGGWRQFLRHILKMKYVIYNLRNLVKNEKTIFAVLLICVFVSAWLMTFSYGLYQNYNSLKIEGEAESKDVRPEINEGETVTRGELKRFLDSLPSELLNDVYLIYCGSSFEFDYKYEDTGKHFIGSMEAFSRFTVHDGVYQTSASLANDWERSGMIAAGRYFTDEEEQNGVQAVILERQIIDDPETHKEYSKMFIDDNTITLFGQPFSIIGTHQSNGAVVPFLSLPPETPIDGFSLSFENIITRSKYETIQQQVNEVFGGKVTLPDMPFPDDEQIYVYNNIMAVSVLIAVLTVLNFAFLYNFIFQKRRRQLSIMQICGCTPLYAWAVCIGECFIICVPTFLIGVLTYIPLMHNVLAGIFEYMEGSYTFGIYAAIFIIYIVTLLLIMGIMLSSQIKKTLLQGQKGG